MSSVQEQGLPGLLQAPPEGGPAMTAPPRLYRSPDHPSHWFAYLGSEGWMIFPAKVNGWLERRPVSGFARERLAAVPLWLAFRTGLLEFAEGRGAERAA